MIHGYSWTWASPRTPRAHSIAALGNLARQRRKRPRQRPDEWSVEAVIALERLHCRVLQLGPP